MAIDGDLIKQKQNIGQSNATTDAASVAPSVAPSPTPTPVPIVSERIVDTPEKPVEISPEAQQKADAEAQETREARATSHRSQVDEVAKMKAQSAQNQEYASDEEFIKAMTKPAVYEKLSEHDKDTIDKLLLKHNISQELKANGKEPTEGEIYNYLLELEKNNELDDKANSLLAQYRDSINKKAFDPNEITSLQNNFKSLKIPSLNVTSGTGTIESGIELKDVTVEERSEIIKGYADIVKDQDIPPEQKVFLTLKQYYLKHDAEFSKFSEQEQKAFINQKLNDEIMTDKKNLSTKDKVLLARDICTMIMEADIRGVPIEKIASMPNDELKSLLKDAKNLNFQVFINNLDKADDEKAINTVIAIYLDATDDNFTLMSKKEKEEYIQKKKDELVSLYSENGIIPKDKKIISKLSVNLLKELNKNNYTPADLGKMSVLEKNQILLDAVANDDAIYKALSFEQKALLDSFRVRQIIGHDLASKGKEFNEGNIYNYLLDLKNKGELEDDEWKALLKDYEVLIEEERFNPEELPTINCNSFVGRAAGLNIKKHAYDTLKDLKPGTEEYNKAINELIKRTNNQNSAFCTRYLLEAITEHAKVSGMEPKEIAKIIDQVKVAKHMETDFNGLSSAGIVSTVSEFGSEQTKDEVGVALDGLIRERNDNFAKNTLGNITHDPDNRFTDTATKAVSETRTKESALNIFKEAINMATPDRKAAITQSSIQTASKEQKLYYAQEYSQIKNSAVTQGLAAATHNETDTEIKSTLTSYVNYATQNNGYSSEEVNNINNARNTGYTSYSYNSASSDNRTSGNDSSSNTASTQNTSNNYSNNNSANSNSSNNVATNPVASAPSSSASTTPKTASNSAEGQAKVVVSPQTQSKLNTMRDNLAQLQYNYSVQIRDKALGSLERIITHIQDDQQVRAQKQAEQKQELQKKEEIAKVLEEAQDQNEKGERVTVATEIVEKQIAKKFNIDEDTVKKLRNAAHEGDLSAIYSLLGSVNSRAQEHFILHISRKSESALAGFIRNHYNDKELIKMLIRLNPNLIKSIDSTLLINCGIEKAEIIKYADATQLKTILADLSKVGNKQQLKQFYDALGDNAQNVASEPPRGSDAWLKQRQQKMADASYSSTSTVVANSRFTDGQTRQKIRPQDVDYREFLA